jgi:hypothetical protein
VNDLGYVVSSIYEQDAQYDTDSHSKATSKSNKNYGYNNIYPEGKYVGG